MADIPSPEQALYWVYTINNPTISPADHLALVLEKAGDAHGYHIFCHERGDNGTPHYQGYLELTKKRRLRPVCKMLGGHAHVEYRRGTQKQAIDYCKKVGEYADKAHTQIAGPFEAGTPAQDNQGARTDLRVAIDTLKEEGLDALIEKHPEEFVKYNRGLNELFNEYMRIQAHKLRPATAPEIILHYGDTGKGKTRFFWDNYPMEKRYSPPLHKEKLKWFSKYRGQEAVLFNEFTGAGSHVPLDYFLELTDRYPLELDSKNGHVWFFPRYIHITTNEHPIRWYDYTKRTAGYNAIKRRVTKVYYHPLVGDLQILDPTLDKELWDRFWSGPDSDNENFTFI